MTEKTKEILKFFGLLLIPGFGIFMLIFIILTADPDLNDYEKREAIHKVFEKESKSIQLPNQFTIKNFEKGGKIGSNILDSITYRTRLNKDETVIQIDTELKKLGWVVWKKEIDNFAYCKNKFTASIYLNNYSPENSTDVTVYFMLGGRPMFGANLPKECQK